MHNVKQKVFESLSNASLNGFDIMEDEDPDIELWALDLKNCDADLEHESYAEIDRAVKDYVTERKRET